MSIKRSLFVGLGSVATVGLVPFATSARPGPQIPKASELAHCSPQWPTHCPHNLPVKGDCFAAGVSCKTLRHCPPEQFARACPPGKQVACWSRPQGGNYGDCR